MRPLPQAKGTPENRNVRVIPREQISESLKKFIREDVQTVFRLEVLLFLHRNQAKSFTVDEVANELGFEHDVAQEQLAALVNIGIRASEADASRYGYEPADERLGALVDQLAHAYPTHRVVVLSLILSERPDRIRVFTEAIKVLRQSH